MDETKKERFLRILSKLEKRLDLKDPEGGECTFYVGYPTWRNSEKFWDIIYSVMQIQKDDDSKPTKEESMNMIKMVTPKIIDYILDYMEHKDNVPLELEEKEYYYIVLQANIDKALELFLDMSNKMFGVTGDVPKNPADQNLSKTD